MIPPSDLVRYGRSDCCRPARLRVRPLGLATNRPRPSGPLCRLKPAFQAGGVITAVGGPAELFPQATNAPRRGVSPWLPRGSDPAGRGSLPARK